MHHERVDHYRQFTTIQSGSPHIAPQTAMACALAEVWRQDRKCQRDQDAALLELARMGVWV